MWVELGRSEADLFLVVSWAQALQPVKEAVEHAIKFFNSKAA